MILIDWIHSLFGTDEKEVEKPITTIPTNIQYNNTIKAATSQDQNWEGLSSDQYLLGQRLLNSLGVVIKAKRKKDMTPEDRKKRVLYCEAGTCFVSEDNGHTNKEDSISELVVENRKYLNPIETGHKDIRSLEEVRKEGNQSFWEILIGLLNVLTRKTENPSLHLKVWLLFASIEKGTCNVVKTLIYLNRIERLDNNLELIEHPELKVLFMMYLDKLVTKYRRIRFPVFQTSIALIEQNSLLLDEIRKNKINMLYIIPDDLMSELSSLCSIASFQLKQAHIVEMMQVGAKICQHLEMLLIKEQVVTGRAGAKMVNQ